jgi:hypothetical protein
MTEQITKEQVKAFEDEYNLLCQKHGLVLTFQPQWKQSQDTGTWSLILVPMIALLPKPQEN